MTLLMMVAGLGVGALAGAALYAGWLRRKAGARLRVPHKWPLRARGLVTTEEHEVWKWLRITFQDHLVMAKVPVLRFTIPIEKDGDKDANLRWLELLNGVYTTFTVCTLDGKVVGCVDVRGKRDASKASRQLKETLLSDCGIPYTAVASKRLPTANAMRAAFLGEMPEELVQEHQPTRGGDSSFHADLDAFTQQRKKDAKDAALKELNKDSHETPQAARTDSIGFNPDGTGGIRVPVPADRFATQWDDSFIQPSDTRPGKLE
ncbi:MAG: DUF2726 domain-containing protein [Polaromonas sp.]